MRFTPSALLCTALLALAPHCIAGLFDQEITFSEAEVQAALARNTKTEMRYAGLIAVSLREQPAIRLGVPEGRAGINAKMDIAFLGNPPIPVEVKGNAGIRYDDQTKAFYLDNPTAESVESIALPREYEPNIRRAVTQLLKAYFREKPVYVLREDASLQEAMARRMLKTVRIEPGKVVATLSPF